MIEFFIALIGIIYYASRYGYEKSKSDKIDREWEEIKRERDKICEATEASTELIRKTQEKLLYGEYYDEICKEFSDDFEYVFGSQWKDKLEIPPYGTGLMPNIYKGEQYRYSVISHFNHITWVYRLMLAKEGKFNWDMFSGGYSIADENNEYGYWDIGIRFAKCIEDRMHRAGQRDINLVVAINADRNTIVPDKFGYSNCKRLW